MILAILAELPFSADAALVVGEAPTGLLVGAVYLQVRVTMSNGLVHLVHSLVLGWGFPLRACPPAELRRAPAVASLAAHPCEGVSHVRDGTRKPVMLLIRPAAGGSAGEL